MDLKVSVVVPAYNGGVYIDACARSLLDQSLAPDDYEVVFVDDGSTDGTRERLEAVARRHDHVRLIRVDNTGGPGGPRNLGLDAARGEYVYFLDCDDWLGPEALERMHAMAARNGSDVLVGRMVGQGGRRVPRAIFRRSADRARILEDHLLSLLTPHKLFRTAFLREHGLRFPEGPVRLEDHRFVLPAYFKAEVISVLADYPCCYWVQRADEGNYSARRFDAAHYFSVVREVLDIVDEHVEPGPVRDRFYAHWLRGKMLRRMGGGTLMNYPPDYRRELHAAIRGLALERFTPQVERHIPWNLRTRAYLLREGTYEDLEILAEAERGITVRPVLRASLTSQSSIGVWFSADFVYRDGRPVAFRHEDGPDGKHRVLWELPAVLPTPVPTEVLDATAALPRATVGLHARHRGSGVEVSLPTTVSRPCEDRGAVTLAGEAHLATAPEAPMPAGTWDLRVRMDVCGWGVERKLAGIRLVVTKEGEILVRTGRKAARKQSRLRRGARRVPGLRRAVRLARSTRTRLRA
ncbi:glycosyltransferase family 2 protein [Spirillospora sp. CA-294931]|uniref:glycosyltransferase family 2 protein n=1 Tax=Spirillospora sp. CA-294931 TaxID=3240042 RepID=UPI003D936B37